MAKETRPQAVALGDRVACNKAKQSLVAWNKAMQSPVAWNKAL